MKPIRMEIAIEKMISEIEDYFETHAMLFKWCIRESKEEETYKIYLFVDYPLSKFVKSYCVLLLDNVKLIPMIQKDICNLINEVITAGVERYGY